jgi:NAD(P)H-hydrate epimerase
MAAAKQVLRLLQSVDVVAIGPGLGTGAGAVSMVREVIRKSPIPVVADADAINALAMSKRGWKAGAPLILTPHLGEMGRLVGRGTAELFAQRLSLATAFSRERGCHLVLKGFRTLICEPGGETWVNPTGNPGMATAGTGDVLTGIIAAFIARNQRRSVASLHDALAAAVFLHGAAGDAAAEHLGQESLMAGDLVQSIPTVLSGSRHPSCC